MVLHTNDWRSWKISMLGQAILLPRTVCGFITSGFGVAAPLFIYELDSPSASIDQVPGLIGPDELAGWQGHLFFTDGTIEVYGRRSNITPAASGHPCIFRLDCPDGGILRETEVHDH